MALGVYFILLTLSLLVGTSFQQMNRRESTCPDGWYTFLGKDEDLCYLYVDDDVTWQEANTRCADQGAILGEPDTDAKNNFVSQIKTSWEVWLGASDIKTEGSWVWGSGSDVVSSSWFPGQPDAYNDATDCLVQYKKVWYDWPCTWKGSYVCEKPATV